MVTFRKMNVEEFQRFREFSIADYAKDLHIDGGFSEEEAAKEAERAFHEPLPDGPDTANEHVLMIEDVKSGKDVGWIWYAYETDGDEKLVFLSDFLIFEENRRRGYATEALAEMERRAKADGYDQSALCVWDHNEAGIALYRKCGYALAERGEGGSFLKKNL